MAARPAPRPAAGRSPATGAAPDTVTSDADPLKAHLLDHTLRVLLRDGYRRFSMNAVASSAKASKETLYRHFGDKTGLLHAALVRSAALIGPLLHDGLDTATSPADRLRRLGVNYLRGLYLPESLALQRIAYADGDHGLGPLFAEEITERALGYVTDEFAAVGSTHPRADAEAYLGMIQGKLHERIMLGAEPGRIDREIADRVDHALALLDPYLRSLR